MSIEIFDAQPRERFHLAADMVRAPERYRIIDRKALRRFVLYTPHHISRLEAAGAFPARLRLGPNRVGWLLGEVLDWIEERKHARAGHPQPRHKSAAAGGDGMDPNWIIDKKELRRFVPYTPQHIRRLEKSRSFPLRIPLGGNRVGWVLGEILDWIADRIRERDERLAAACNAEF